jgi:hypothetical protein
MVDEGQARLRRATTRRRHRCCLATRSTAHGAAGLVEQAGAARAEEAHGQQREVAFPDLLAAGDFDRLARAPVEWLVREPFPVVGTGTSLDHGRLLDDAWIWPVRWAKAARSSPTAR